MAVPTIESFVERASSVIRDIEPFLEGQMKNAGKTAGWLPNR